VLQGSFGGCNELGQHGCDTIGEILSLNDVFLRGKFVNLDAIECDDKFFVFSERYFIGGSTGLTTFANAFSDVERDAPGCASHLGAKVGFATGELRDHAPYDPIELKGTAIDIKLVDVIEAFSIHRIAPFVVGDRERA